MTVSAVAGSAAMVVFAFTMVYAGLTDLTTMKIRNGLVLLLGATYMVLVPFSGLSLAEFGTSIAIGTGVLAGAFGLFAFGWIGGGDAKLAAATALWFGAEHTPAYLLYTALFGGAFSLLILQFRALPLMPSLQNSPWIARLHAKESGVPYGVAMALAALVLFPHTRWMTPLF